MIVFSLPGVGQRGGRRFVDDVDDVEAGDAPGVLRRLAAHIVEVIRDRDDGVGDRPDMLLRILFELFENQGRYEFGGELLSLIDFVPVLVSHLPLDRLDDVVGRLNRNPLGRGTNDHMPGFSQQHHRGSRGLPVGVRDRIRLAFVVELRQR